MSEKDATITKGLRVMRLEAAAYDPPDEYGVPNWLWARPDSQRYFQAANCFAWFSRKSMTWLWAVK